MSDDELSMSDSQQAVLEACRREVARLREEFGWDLLPPDVFAQQTYAVVLRLRLAPRSAAQHVYAPVLYAACADICDQERRNAGFTQTFAYLYVIISKRSFQQDYAREMAQNALTRIFYALADCQKPQAFLAFATWKLTDAIKADRRARQRDGKRTVSLHAPAQGAFWDHDAALLGERSLDRARETAQAPEHAINQGQLQRIIRELIVRSLSDYPKARRQLVAFWLKHWDDLDAASIGEILRVSPESVHALCSRAKHKLEADQAWLDALADSDLGGPAGTD